MNPAFLLQDFSEPLEWLLTLQAASLYLGTLHSLGREGSADPDLATADPYCRLALAWLLQSCHVGAACSDPMLC